MHILFVLLCLVAHADLRPPPRFSILQGATADHVTHFTVVARDYEDLSFAVGNQKPENVQRVGQDGSEWVVYRLRYGGLEAHTNYQLEVRDREGRLKDVRDFETLDTKAETGRVAFGSCMVTQLHNPWMWQSVAKAGPDLILLMGDAVYLDRPTVWRQDIPTTRLQIWQGYTRSRNRLGLYFWPRLRPTLSVWDDHDSGYDNDDGNSAQMKEARAVFDTFFANDAIDGFLQHGPALAKQFELYGRNFILLDGRTYRDLDAASPLFGADQIAWLHAQVRPGPNFVLSGTQFYGGFIKKDSLEYNWPQYAPRFTQDLRAVGQARGASFVFGSGDVHFSEVMRLEPALYGYETFEITSSSVHSFGFPGHYLMKPANPRRIAVTGTHNMIMLELDRRQPAIRVRSVGWRGGDLFNLQVQPQACETWLTAQAK